MRKKTKKRKLDQLLNNGESKVKIINIYPGITDEYLYSIFNK